MGVSGAVCEQQAAFVVCQPLCASNTCQHWRATWSHTAPAEQHACTIQTPHLTAWHPSSYIPYSRTHPCLLPPTPNTLSASHRVAQEATVAAAAEGAAREEAQAALSLMEEELVALRSDLAMLVSYKSSADSSVTTDTGAVYAAR